MTWAERLLQELDELERRTWYQPAAWACHGTWTICGVTITVVNGIMERWA